MADAVVFPAGLSTGAGTASSQTETPVPWGGSLSKERSVEAVAAERRLPLLGRLDGIEVTAKSKEGIRLGNRLSAN